MSSTARRLLTVVLGTLGLVAVAAGPASAGLVSANHCQPVPVAGAEGSGS